MKLAVVNAFLCSTVMAPESSFDATKQRCQLVGTPSAECCRKSKFFPRGNLGFNIKLSGNSQKSSARSSSSNLQNNLLVSPTPPSGCQAQGVKVTKMKYDNKCNKVNMMR
jgi:hypothetical protein